MAESQDLAATPPAPRSLRTVRGARLELARLYAQTKRGKVDPNVAGKLAHMLSLLIGTARDHDFEARPMAIEAAVARKTNGDAGAHRTAATSATNGAHADG